MQESIDSKSRCQLGALFVHGIGEQKEGETLTAFGEPLIEWMRSWIGGRGQPGDGIEVKYASLFPSRRQSADPAHAMLEIRFTPAEGSQRRQQWLFAESWWGEQVQPPAVFDLLAWLFGRGVWVLFAHLAERAWQFTHPRHEGDGTWSKLKRGLDRARWRYLAWPLAGALFLPLATLFQALLLVAWIVALVPVPTVRRYLAIVLQRGTLILGDSYGFVANETQRGAILTRFQSAVHWLQERCEHLVIVAHSQGTAVVHAAVQGSFVARPPLLITFGSGLAKLAQLRHCETAATAPLVAAGWIVPTALLTIYLAAWMDRNPGRDADNLAIVAWGLGISSLFCAVLAAVAWYRTRSDSSLAQSPLAGQSARWIDLYASSDPVPQGDLAQHLPGHGLSSERIVNRRSVLGDHSAYWRNKPQFVSRIVAELDREARILGVPDLDSDEAYQLALAHHHRAIVSMSIAWWVMCVSLVVIAVVHRMRLAELGHGFVAALENGPTMVKWVADYLKGTGQFAEWLTAQLMGTVPHWLPLLGHWGVVLAGGLLVAYLWWQLIAGLLIKWDQAQLGDFLGNPRSPWWGAYGTWMVWPFVIAFTIVPPVSVAYAVEMGASGAWLLPLKTMAALLVAEFAFFQFLAIKGVLFAAIKESRAIWRYARDALIEACTPGDVAKGWSSRWGGFAAVFVASLFLGIGLDWLLGKFEATAAIAQRALSLPYLVAAALLLVRLVRLAGARGWDIWLSALAISVPLLVTGAYFSRVEPALEASAVVAVTAMITAVFAAIVYPAAARWLPARQRRS